MKKKKAIELLNSQLEKIDDNQIKREEWLMSTSSVLSRIFPLSASYKIDQLEKIRESPDYFEEISERKRIQTRKTMAARFLKNHIEEIELLGMEGSGSKLVAFFGSFRFWLILTGVCSLSFIIGNSAAKPHIQSFKHSQQEESQDLERLLYLQKKKVDSLIEEIRFMRTLG